MKELEEMIMQKGEILEGDVLKVGSFLNHQIDTDLLKRMALEVARIYDGKEVTKILTVEASGIAIAAAVGMTMNVPVIFAKKSKTANVSDDVYSARVHSYTHGNDSDIIVPKKFINENDKLLLIDDFLARGEAFMGLVSICEQANAQIVGCTAQVEKSYQGGAEQLRKHGIFVHSLAVVDEMKDGKIKFGVN